MSRTAKEQKTLADSLGRIAPIEKRWLEDAASRQSQLTKPPGSLGRLEDMAARLCAIQETLKPVSNPRRIVVFAADHGVTAEGVSPYPSEVTAQMVSNFLTGGAAINALAREAKAEVRVVDVGVASKVPCDRVSREQNVKFVSRRVREGTRNLAREEAMTESEMLAAVLVGVEEAERAADEGVVLLGMGEMGIGNTTAASAVTAALTGLAPSRVTGRGTGVDDAGLAHKIETVERALDVNRPRPGKALDILRKVGGLEIAGLCGLCIGAAARRRAVVSDGFIATSAAALAVRLCPSIGDYLFAAHVSSEPGHAVLLEVLGLRPMLNLEMRLGEGTGAALAFNIMGAAVAAFNDMATFESAGVKNKGD